MQTTEQISSSAFKNIAPLRGQKKENRVYERDDRKLKVYTRNMQVTTRNSH